MPSTCRRPDRHSTYSARDEFIRAKYDKRAFLHPPLPEQWDSEAELEKWGAALLLACESGDVGGALNAIAHGATTCFVPSEVVCHPSLKRYPLHVSARYGSFICAVLLAANGADINERDAEGRSVSEIAAQYGHDDIEAFVVRRVEVLRERAGSKHPIGIAVAPAAATAVAAARPTEAATDQLSESYKEVRDMVTQALDGNTTSSEGEDGSCSSGAPLSPPEQEME